MAEVRKQIVTADEDGVRLDRWFKRHYPSTNHHTIEKLLRTGQIRVDGKRCKAGSRVSAGEEIRIPPSLSQPAQVRKQVSQTDKRLLEAMTLYRDDDIVVLNKPSGLAVQGGSKTQAHLDGMFHSLESKGGQRPKLVHRLDKETSGVLIAGCNEFAASRLAEAFRARRVTKLYWALCFGVPRPARGKIKSSVQKSNDRTAPAKMAETSYRVISAAGRRFAWLGLEPRTGRTHQLRLHCLEMGHPLVGDRRYHLPNYQLVDANIPKKLHLHARVLALKHPRTGEDLRFVAQLSDHMQETWSLLGFQAPIDADELLEFHE